MSSQDFRPYRRPTVEDTVVSEAGFSPGKSRSSSARPSRRSSAVISASARQSPSDSGYSSQSHPSLADSANASPLPPLESSLFRTLSQSRPRSPAVGTNTPIVRRQSRTRSDTGSGARRPMASDQASYAPSGKSRPRLAPVNIPRSSSFAAPSAVVPGLGQYQPMPSHFPPPTYRYNQTSAPPTPQSYMGFQQPQPNPLRSGSVGNYFPQQSVSIPRSSPISPFTHQPVGSPPFQQTQRALPTISRPRPVTWHTEPPNVHYQNALVAVPPRTNGRHHSHPSASQRKSIRPMQMPRGSGSRCLPKQGKHVEKPNKRYSESKDRHIPVNCCQECCSSEEEETTEESEDDTVRVSDEDRHIRADVKITTRDGKERMKSMVIDRKMLKDIITRPNEKGGKRRAITCLTPSPERDTLGEAVEDKAQSALNYQERISQAAHRDSATPAYMADTVGETSKASSLRRDSYSETPLSPTRSRRSESKGSGVSGSGHSFVIRSKADLNFEDGEGRSITVPAPREGEYAEMRVNEGRKDKDYFRSDVSRSSRRTRGSRSSPPLDTIVESSTRRRPTTTPDGY